MMVWEDRKWPAKNRHVYRCAESEVGRPMRREKVLWSDQLSDAKQVPKLIDDIKPTKLGKHHQQHDQHEQ